MTVVEAEDDALVVDAGLAFPRDEHLGVDLILPDFSYLRDRERPIRAVLLTHAHEDHVGGLPYLLRECRVQEIWATRLTLGPDQVEARRARPAARGRAPRGRSRRRPGRDRARSRAEFVRVAHSIPDAVAIVLDTPGRPHPAHGRLQARPHAGRRPAHRRRPPRRDRKPRRRPLPRRLDERRATGRDRLRAARRRGLPPADPAPHGRILVASFASNVHRMQQAVDVAVEVGRKVCVVGRSMRKNVNIARNLGYMEVPEDALIRPEPARRVRAAARC